MLLLGQCVLWEILRFFNYGKDTLASPSMCILRFTLINSITKMIFFPVIIRKFYANEVNNWELESCSESKTINEKSCIKIEVWWSGQHIACHSAIGAVDQVHKLWVVSLYLRVVALALWVVWQVASSSCLVGFYVYYRVGRMIDEGGRGEAYL